MEIVSLDKLLIDSGFVQTGTENGTPVYGPKKEPKMKAIQMLTQESIYTIQRAIMFLETYNDVIPYPKTPEVIAELKKIIEDVTED